jgi:Queuosine salvage protein
MESSPTERVRNTCKAVADRAMCVRIDHEFVPSYAASLPLEQATAPELDRVRHYFGNRDDTVAFFLTLDAINFGSGYFPYLRKRPGMSGYFTVAASLTDLYREHGPLSAQELAELTIEDCTRIFGQDPDNEPIHELMNHFATALNDLGQYLLDRFDGSFTGLLEEANSSAERLIRLLVEMPYFDDVEPYDGLEVPFYKRAQLMAADLAVAFRGQGPGHFQDLDRLTIFADNLVPHVLRIDGILLYEEDLAMHIDAEEPIQPGTPEEVEIRTCTVHAVECLVRELRGSGHEITAMGLDYLLWNRGQQPYYKRIRPRHRTRTVFY